MPRQSLALLAALALATPAAAQAPVEQGPKNVPAFEPAFENQTRAPRAESHVELDRETVADGFVRPWAVEEMPSGQLLVTERPGRLRVIGMDGSVSAPVEGLPEVFAEKQGGLLDVKVAPDFEDSRLIYWTYAEPRGEGESGATLARGRLSEDDARVEDVEVLFRAEPSWPNGMHFGSRIAFDGEGHVFVSLGERFTEETRVMAQDLDTHFGKIVRLNLDGSVPEDNPFKGVDGARPEIWSLGHRNVQAALWDDQKGRLAAIEHGPQGGDELNFPEAGKNYGWPVISYGQNYDGTEVGDGISKKDGMEQPVYYWDPVIAPSGMEIVRGDMFPEWRGDILVGGLVTHDIVRLALENGRVTGEERLAQDVGRVRDIEETADGALLVAIDAEGGSILRFTRAD